MIRLSVALAALCLPLAGIAAYGLEAAQGQRLAPAAAPALQPTGRVTDAAGILSPDQELRLTRQLEALERTTKHQMVVVTVPTLGGQDIGPFTQALGNAWGIGRKDVDDSVILLVAPSERKVRIAVASGLEKRLPDSLCERILTEQVLPRFRSGDLPGGVEAGVSALVGELR